MFHSRLNLPKAKQNLKSSIKEFVHELSHELSNALTIKILAEQTKATFDRSIMVKFQDPRP